MLILLVGVWVASSLAATTAALAWYVRGEREWKRLSIVLTAVGLPLGFAAWMVGLWFLQHASAGVGNVPVVGGVVALAIHVGGLIALAIGRS